MLRLSFLPYGILYGKLRFVGMMANMKKKILSLILIITILMTLAGCGSKDVVPERAEIINTSGTIESSEETKASEGSLSVELNSDDLKEEEVPEATREKGDGRIESYIKNGSEIDFVGYFEDNGAYAHVYDGISGVSAWFGNWNVQVLLGAAYVRYNYPDKNHGAYTISRNTALFGEGDITELTLTGTEYKIRRHIIDFLPTLVDCIKSADEDNIQFDGIIDEGPHYEENKRIDPKTEYWWYFL